MITMLKRDRDGNMMIILSQCQHIDGEMVEIPVDQDLGLPEIPPQSTFNLKNDTVPPEPLIRFIAKDYDDDLS